MTTPLPTHIDPATHWAVLDYELESFMAGEHEAYLFADVKGVIRSYLRMRKAQIEAENE